MVEDDPALKEACYPTVIIIIIIKQIEFDEAHINNCPSPLNI